MSASDLEYPAESSSEKSGEGHIGMITGVARRLAARGWFPAGGGSLTMALSPNPLTILTTGAGAPKDRLTPRDTLIVDEEGISMTPRTREADRAFEVARCLIRNGAGAVIHTFTTWGLLATTQQVNQAIPITGHELLRAFSNWQEDTPLSVPVIDGRQDMGTLLRRLESILTREPGRTPGFLARGFGVFAWGEDLLTAERHTEALHFFLELMGKRG